MFEIIANYFQLYLERNNASVSDDDSISETGAISNISSEAVLKKLQI